MWFKNWSVFFIFLTMRKENTILGIKINIFWVIGSYVIEWHSINFIL